MALAHILLGLAGATAVAAWAFFGAGTSVWMAVLAYAGAGNAICLTSIGIALLAADRADWRRPQDRVPPHTIEGRRRAAEMDDPEFADAPLAAAAAS